MINSLYVALACVLLAFVLNLIFFDIRPAPRWLAILLAIIVLLIVFIFKTALKDNYPFGGGFAFPILFYITLKKKRPVKNLVP